MATLIAVQVILSIILAAFSGPGPAAIAEIFPTRERSTWMTAGYALSVSMLAAAAFICVWLTAAAHSPLRPVSIFMAAAVVSTAVISRLKETAFSVLK